jgi:hypothetical protein
MSCRISPTIPEVFVVEQNVPKRLAGGLRPAAGRIDSGVGWAIPSITTRSRSFASTFEPGEAVRLHVGERHTTPLKTKVLKAAQVSNSGDL